jgi:hypothetical protein
MDKAYTDLKRKLSSEKEMRISPTTVRSRIPLKADDYR